MRLLLLVLVAGVLSCQSFARNLHKSPKIATSNTAIDSSKSAPAAAAAADQAKPAAAAAAAAGGALNSSSNALQGYPSSHGMLALEDLLTAIQNAHVYEDSKTAVDLVLKSDVKDVAAAFAKWQAANNETDAAALRQFISQHLDEAGSDLTPCTPPDWQQQPPNFLPRLAAAAAAGDNASYGTGMNASAAELYDFGLKVHALWKVLCREVSPDVYAHPERHSLLPLPNRTVVPGDRFREVYYWDSYWVIRGLLISKMTDTALGMVSNLLSMLERLGHVPNGARVYYLNRSQPPLLSAMIREVYEALSEDSSSSSRRRSDLLQRALPLLLTEHHYWTSPPKQVRVLSQDGAAVYNLSRYYADWYQPRPESYREDAALAAEVTSSMVDQTTAAAARQLYFEIASGAESGWDFSSRWFEDNKSLATIQTTKVVPCDLNAWLYQLERNIAWMANITGDAATSDKFNKAAQQRKQAIDALLWDNEAAMWRDGILTPNNTTTSSSSSSPDADHQLYALHQNRLMFASNFVPLWTGITEGDDDHDDGDHDHDGDVGHSSRGPRVVEALKMSGLIGPAGISTTLYPTGHQWDAPNGWPPLQHMLIEAASRFGGQLGDQVAADLARTWVGVNLSVYKATGFMHEKYDVSVAGGLVGGGGEYKPQVGFGWTNGVLLDLLNTYF